MGVMARWLIDNANLADLLCFGAVCAGLGALALWMVQRVAAALSSPHWDDTKYRR